MVVSVSNRDAMMMEPIGVIRGVSNSNKAYWPSLALEKRWKRGGKEVQKVEKVAKLEERGLVLQTEARSVLVGPTFGMCNS